MTLVPQVVQVVAAVMMAELAAVEYEPVPFAPPVQGVQAPIVLAVAVQEPVWDVPAGQAAGQAVQTGALVVDVKLEPSTQGAQALSLVLVPFAAT